MSRKVPFEITPTHTFKEAAKTAGLVAAGASGIAMDVWALWMEFRGGGKADWDITTVAAEAFVLGMAIASFVGARDVVKNFRDDMQNEKNLPAWNAHIAALEAGKAATRNPPMRAEL